MSSVVEAWVDGALEERGWVRGSRLERVKRRPWATVRCADTSDGRVYFKANALGGRHEPELTDALARRWPDRVLAPLAVDPGRGWMLTLDHGPPLSKAFDPHGALAVWEDVLPRYAELQIESAREPQRWLALGVPDRRLERLPDLVEGLVRESADLGDEERSRMLRRRADLEASCRELQSCARPATLEHGDLHANNLLTGRGAMWLFDWADASVSYPWLSLLVTLEHATRGLAEDARVRGGGRLVDAYLEAWTPHASRSAMRELLPHAFWIACAGRALDWAHMLGGAERDPGYGRWVPQVGVWLRRWLDGGPRSESARSWCRGSP